MNQAPGWSMLAADPMIQAGTVAVFGFLVTRVGLRSHPTYKLVGQVFFFVALTVLLLYHGIVPYQTEPQATAVVERVFIAVAKIIWWINATWALIGFVRVYLKFEGQPREGRLVQDLVVGLIYLGAILSIVAYVFGVPVGTLIATSGVFAIILGLAMQSTLNDVFSGIALNLGRPYTIGDWIVLHDGTEGKVFETNWRSTHLVNGTNDLVVLPNSFLAKVGLTNLNSPDRSHGITITVRVVPSASPNTISEVMRTVLLSSSWALPDPAPTVAVKAMTGDAVDLDLSFRVANLGGALSAKNEMFDLIYRHCRAAGLMLARPLEAQGAPPQITQQNEPTKPKRKTPLRLLDAIPLFASLDETEKETLAAAMTRRSYRRDDLLIEQGDTVSTLTIVRAGAILATRTTGLRSEEVARLAPGDYFGETGFLLGVGEAASLRALSNVVVYEIDQPSLAALLEKRPTIAEDLATTLSRRVKEDALVKAVQEADHQTGSVSNMVMRIRQLFGASAL